MKITNAYVAATKDGQFYRLSQRQTHTGHHIELESVNDIEQASTFSSPMFDTWEARQRVGHKVHAWLPVQIKREVVLTGFGITPR